MAPVRKGGLGRGVEGLIPNYNKDDKKEKKTIKKSNDKASEKLIVDQNEPIIKEVVKEVQIVKEVPADTIVNINDIEPNREQPRKQFDKEELDELAGSIEQYGLIQPLIVQKKDEYYEIVAGERRWRAAKIAGLKEVPVIIKQYTDREVMEIALIENIQRKDLNQIEEALAYRNLIDEYNITQEELAHRMSKSRTAITNSLRLLKLAKEVQQMIINDEISMGHARALLAIEYEELQIETAKEIANRRLSVRETEKLVKNILNPKQTHLDIPSAADSAYEKLQNHLKDLMGTKVSINHKKGGKGKIEIEYYSQDELERLLELFDGIQN